MLLSRSHFKTLLDEATRLHAVYLPGLFLTGTIAIAAKYLSEHYGGPAMLFAFLIGAAFNFLAEDKKIASGVHISAKLLLRIGVALLGARITLAHFSSLGLGVVLLTLGGVIMTIVAGWAIGRAFRLPGELAILSAGAVAICGASAALAISAILHQNKQTERHTTLVVIGVTTLSTLAMIAYPLLSAALGFSDKEAGIFIGATIHDVAQVIGAGYTVSETAGDTATIVKLLRVSCLLPVIIILGLIFRRSAAPTETHAPLIPWFLVAFIAMVGISSTGIIATDVREAISTLSGWLLLTAVAALGVRTALKDLVAVGPKPLMVLICQTVLLAAVIALALTAFIPF